MKRIYLIILAMILVLGGILRFYKLDQIPPSLNWDEVAAGYNAFTIANWGADEYGNKFPIVFKNFGDDKHPVHIYLTAIVVKIFGSSDFSTRADSAGVGVLSILAIYILVRQLFKNEPAALFSGLFIAVSPYAIHYSRGLWEANFALFFLIAGFACFYVSLGKRLWFFPLSFVFFGLSFFSYHSAKVVVPPLVLLLCLIHFRQLVANKKILLCSIAIVMLFTGLVIKDPRILGFARIDQNKFSEEVTKPYGGELGTVIHNYKGYFTFSYLFENGDLKPRASVKTIGEFYKIDLVLIAVGIIALLLRRKWEGLLVLLSWLALTPIPGAVSALEPSATRGIFMIAPVLIFSATGAEAIISVFRKSWLKIAVLVILLTILSKEASHYVNYYFTEYSKKDAIEWQYGMKQIADYVKRNPDYVKVYMDKIRQQPYIFFLYYLKTPLPELLKTVKYDESESKSYNTVSSFDKYQFGGWNIINSYPNYKILYIVTPSYYGGLRFVNQFDVNELIKYPDGSDAFYVVSGNQ